MSTRPLQKTKNVTCIIPAFNEAKNIARVVREVSEQVPNLLEVIVVDDSSEDETALIAQNAGAKVLKLEKHGGKGTAVRAGLRVAQSDVVLLIDGDGQDDPKEAKRLLEALGPDVDMVLGSRFLGIFREGSVTPLHWFGNIFLTKVFNLLFKQRLTDAQAGFRVFWRSAVPEACLVAKGYEIEADINTVVAMRGGRIIEVPVSRDRRVFGFSRFRTFSDGMRILALLLKRKFGLI